MRPEHHIIISFLVSLIFLLLTGSVLGSLLCFFVGFLIDSDHLIDYLIDVRRIPTPKQFFDYFYGLKYDKFRIFFHSIELIPVIFFVGRYFIGDILTYGILTGFTVHLICDIIYNPEREFTYFLTYRILMGFKRSRLSYV